MEQQRDVKLESVPEPFSKTCFKVPGLFTPEECEELKGKMASDALRIDTRKDKKEVEEEEESSPDFILRIVERTSLKDPDLAKWLWEHLSGVLPQVWKVDEEDEHMGPFARGEWELEGIDHRIQLYRYEPGGIFTQHRDGPTYHSADLRSFFTVLVYLNEGYTGGHTTLFTDDMSTHYKVEAGKGNCFIMLQRTLHEGSKVEEGIKCALRCDALYRRAANNKAEDCVKHLNTTEQARQWFKLASALELSGCVEASVPYYRRAQKLDPSVLETED